MVSPQTQISPHLMNSGECYVKDGLEYFVFGVNVDNDHVAPVLTIRCHQGHVSLQSPMKKMVEDNDDGVS